MVTQLYIMITICRAPNADAISSSMHCKVMLQDHPLASSMTLEKVRPLRLLFIVILAKLRCLNILQSMTQYH